MSCRFSAVMPMFRALGSTSFSEMNRGLGSAPCAMGWCPMCSTPPAMIRSAAPMAISEAPKQVAVMPPAHMRSTDTPGTEAGSPERITVVRPMVIPWSPIWVVAPQTLSSMRSLGTWGLRSSRVRMTLTTMSSARVSQNTPFWPARPKAVRTTSTR